MIYDISQEVFSCRVYPGDPAPAFERARSMERGDLYNMTTFSMCAHNGTHVDAPFHFLGEGKTIDRLGLKPFVGDCFVARCRGDLTAEDALEILERARQAGAKHRLLLAGELVVTAEAAKVFAQAKLLLLGNESQTVGPENAPMEVHKILLGAEVALLEGVVLRDISEGKYFLSAAPLNLAGADGAPTRAYLIQ